MTQPWNTPPILPREQRLEFAATVAAVGLAGFACKCWIDRMQAERERNTPGEKGRQ